MRVGHFVPHYPGSGGITSMVLGLSAGLIDQGHQVSIYGYGAGPTHDEDLTRARAADLGIAQHLYPTPGRTFYARPRGGLIDRLRRNEDSLDALLIHGIFGLFSPAISRAALEGGITAIACPHDPYTPEIFTHRSLTKRGYMRAVEVPYLRRCAAVHMLAPSHETYLRSFGVAVPAIILPNGVSWPHLSGRRTKGPSLADGAPFEFLYLGRWDIHNKGLDILLGAISVSKRRFPLSLRIGGRGSVEQRRALEELITRLDIGEVVTIEGFIDDASLAMEAADALILPSRFDGFGQVVLEALAVGTPVLVSNRAGASEHLSILDGALVVDPSERSLVEAIQQARVAAPSLRRAIQDRRASLEERFSWPAIARTWAGQVELTQFSSQGRAG